MEWEKYFGNEVEVNSAMFNLGLCYNLYSSADRSHGLFLTFGGFWSKRAMNVDVVDKTDAEVTSSRAIPDTNSLTKLYAIMICRF